MPARRIYLIRSDSPNWLGLRMVLNDTPVVILVGETASVQEARVQAPLLQPDLVISAIDVEGTSAVPLLTYIHEILPGTQFLIMAGRYRPDELLKIAEINIAGYFLWDDLDNQAFADACAAVRSGAFVVSSRSVATAFFEACFARQHAIAMLANLTDRQRAVLHLVTAGRTNQAIAADLCIRANTVATHVERLKEKLGVSTRSQLAALGLRLQVAA